VPLYEYECTKCHHRFEVIQKLSDAPLTKCPKCKGRLEKLISAPAIQFKGSGWYVTDYGKGQAAGSNTKPQRPSGKDEAPPSTAKTPAKTEEKSKTGSSGSGSSGGSGGAGGSGGSGDKDKK